MVVVQWNPYVSLGIFGMAVVDVPREVPPCGARNRSDGQLPHRRREARSAINAELVYSESKLSLERRIRPGLLVPGRTPRS